MRSERRHELQQNALADWMADALARVKPYANAILAAVLLVVIVAVATTLWVQRSRAQRTTAWSMLYGALESRDSVAAMAEVIEQHPDSDAAQWALVLSSDVRLVSGSRERFRSKAVANQDLDKAIEGYEALLEDSRNPIMAERATFGLARAREMLGELDKARELYQKIVQQWPEGPYTTAAADRLRDLQRPETKAFYDRFAQFDPQPAYSTESGIPGGRLPFDESSLPAGGDDLFPPLDPLKLQQSGKLNAPGAPAQENATKPSEPAPKDAAPKLPAELPKDDTAKPPAEPPKPEAAKPPADAVSPPAAVAPEGPAVAEPKAPEGESPPTPDEKKPDGK